MLPEAWRRHIWNEEKHTIDTGSGSVYSVGGLQHIIIFFLPSQLATANVAAAGDKAKNIDMAQMHKSDKGRQNFRFESFKILPPRRQIVRACKVQDGDFHRP